MNKLVRGVAVCIIGGVPNETSHAAGGRDEFSSSIWTIAMSADGTPTSAPPERLIDRVGFAVDDLSWLPDSRRILKNDQTSAQSKSPWS